MSAQCEAPSLLRILRNAGLTVALALACSAPARASDWLVAPNSQARIVDGGFLDGARYALVQIRLAGSAVTYWRDPGDAGSPPTFDFADSDNLGDPTTYYPQPTRINEGGSVAFGYQHEVIFPILITPVEPAKPMTLALKLDYAVCDKICTPAHIQLSAVFDPQPQAPETALLADAMKNVPKALDGEAAAKVASIAPAPPADGKTQWLVTINDGDGRDLFVEPPAGFYFDVKPTANKNAFLLAMVEHPPKRLRPEAPLRVTIARPSPVEFDLVLPAKN